MFWPWDNVIWAFSKPGHMITKDLFLGYHFVSLFTLFFVVTNLLHKKMFRENQVLYKLFLSWTAYNPDDCMNFKLFSCYDNFVTTGPDPRGPVLQDDESDEEVQEEDNGSEDHYALLVKAWEQKVFPVIRRRFRNEAQRKDGLEQIRGALQLGWFQMACFREQFWKWREKTGIMWSWKSTNIHCNVLMQWTWIAKLHVN